MSSVRTAFCCAVFLVAGARSALALATPQPMRTPVPKPMGLRTDYQGHRVQPCGAGLAKVAHPRPPAAGITVISHPGPHKAKAIPTCAPQPKKLQLVAPSHP